MPLKLYLAGPDVFRADAVEHLGRMKEEAAALGFEAFSPLDSEVDIHDENIVRTIFDINMEDIARCDVLVANVEAFRGCCVDDGTAFELGVAFVKGKRVLCYSSTAKMPLKDRVHRDFELHGDWLQKDQFPRTEDFPGCKNPGPVNLMITEALRASGIETMLETYSQCLQFLAEEGAPCKLRRTEPKTATPHVVFADAATTRKLYLAGPDVFRADAMEHLGKMKEEAAKFGCEAFSPLDSEVDIHDENIVRTIFDINMDDIDRCGVVVANIEPFRGCCVDDGTAFELGVAFAKGKRIVCYLPTARTPLKDRVQQDFKEHGEYLQKDRFPRTEDFPGCKAPGPVNLMITEALRATDRGGIFESYTQCLEFVTKSEDGADTAFVHGGGA